MKIANMVCSVKKMHTYEFKINAMFDKVIMIKQHSPCSLRLSNDFQNFELSIDVIEHVKMALY